MPTYVDVTCAFVLVEYVCINVKNKTWLLRCYVFLSPLTPDTLYLLRALSRRFINKFNLFILKLAVGNLSILKHSGKSVHYDRVGFQGVLSQPTAVNDFVEILKIMTISWSKNGKRSIIPRWNVLQLILSTYHRNGDHKFFIVLLKYSKVDKVLEFLPGMEDTNLDGYKKKQSTSNHKLWITRIVFKRFEDASRLQLVSQEDYI